MKRVKTLFLSLIISFVASLLLCLASVIIVDPYFHYHAPLTNAFSYSLDDERYVNDGIIKHFDYDSIITGTSMVQNFKSSEYDELFNAKSIKVPYSGATFKEINDAVELACNKKAKAVIRGVDCSKLLTDPNGMREDLGDYPDYLYDKNPFNDVNYLFDSKVFFQKTINALMDFIRGKKGSITSFDEYGYWHNDVSFGKNSITSEPISNVYLYEQPSLTSEQKTTLEKNIKQNLIATPLKHKDVTFYYFLTPYSALYWKVLLETQKFGQYVEAEEYLIKEILKIPNIKLFSFNDCFDITANLNFYKDLTHYGAWVNSYILRCLKNNKHIVNASNIDTYLDNFYNFYTTYEFSKLNNLIDFENDEEASELILKLENEGKI